MRPCGRWDFICPRVHVSALSDRLGSELGVGYLHHRQRPLRQASVAERPVALPPVQGKGAADVLPIFHLSDNTPASAHRHRDRCAKPSSRLEGNAQRQMPTLPRGARNLSPRDIYQWRAETTDFAGSSRGSPIRLPHSITSSAATSSLSGTDRPSIWAVLTSPPFGNSTVIAVWLRSNRLSARYGVGTASHGRSPFIIGVGVGTNKVRGSSSTVGCDRVLRSGEHGSPKEAGHEQVVPQHS